ncbi:interactor protein for cytohesin exchange factors 1 [Aplysia californica]|uniref:Interactor protein for cytohesin exchange factors 1 n=1 Tax=Aplysia californica TaxID=6500 RepID=A0ABM0JNX5_APLCA|nr:interactor protein for cytohesin exchange factors 1 [Aplysia californica]XP_005098099.1 interactor protein for cytohesin exchange factors 1 [Aplysia californica]
MASDYDPGILGVVVPQKCSCQFLLSGTTIVQSGWLRKKSLRNKIQLKIFNWPQMFVVIADKCLYYFSNELAKKPAGAVSLYGFNRIIRFRQEHPNDPSWAFKLEHVQPDMRSFYFAASSEHELIKWMKVIKQEMLVANNRSSTRAKAPSSDGISLASSGSFGSVDYHDIEASVYYEPTKRRPVSTISDFTSNAESEYHEDVMFEDSGEFEEISEPSDSPPKETFMASLVQGLKERQLQKDAVSQGYCLQTVPPPVSDNRETQTYWSSVRFHGSKEEASKAMAPVSEDGVYLVRKSEDLSDVLLVRSGSNSRKYRIFVKDDGKLTLSPTSPCFDKLEQLLFHYYSNDLPNSVLRLSAPYSIYVGQSD